MAIEVILRDGQGKNGAAPVVNHKTDVPSGIVTYTEPYRTVIAQSKFAINEASGSDMNQDASFGGTPDGIHNGTDSVLWTASALSGTWVFDSTAQAQAGTKSIDGTATKKNDEAQFERSSAIASSSYVGLSGFIYLTAWPGGASIELEFRLAGALVGNLVNVQDYVDVNSLNVWQKFSIPLDAIGLSGNIDQFIVRPAGANPDFYLDTLQLEETGGSQIFSLVPDTGSIFRANSLTISMADAYDCTLANSSVPNIKYNQLLGVSKLPNGIVLRLTTGGVVRFQAVLQQHLDIVQLPFDWQAAGDGTNTSISYKIQLADTPFVLDSRSGDRADFIINDDLSGLLHLRAVYRGSKEITA